jgi:hypothetical protein
MEIMKRAASECAAAMAHPAAEGVTGEQSRAESRARGSNRAGPSGYPGFRAGNGQAEATGRRAGGQEKQSVFFWQFCDIAKSDDDPQEDLAIFGYNLKMKAILIQKNPSILSSSQLEPCIKNMAIINQKFWKF